MWEFSEIGIEKIKNRIENRIEKEKKLQIKILEAKNSENKFRNENSYSLFSTNKINYRSKKLIEMQHEQLKYLVNSYPKNINFDILNFIYSIK